jgi:hypothetical protein
MYSKTHGLLRVTLSPSFSQDDSIARSCPRTAAHFHKINFEEQHVVTAQSLGESELGNREVDAMRNLCRETDAVLPSRDVHNPAAHFKCRTWYFVHGYVSSLSCGNTTSQCAARDLAELKEETWDK